MKNFIRNNKGLIIITITYLLLVLLMLPLRNVVMDDDFAYILTVRNFLNTGTLKILDWAAVSLVFQAMWGSLFSFIFGYSIRTLIVSNIVIVYLGLIFFYLLLKELRLTNSKATIFTLLMLGIPFVLQYTFSFMTDTFYMSLLIISMYFYISGLRKNSNRKIFVGSLVAAAGFLTRQITAVVPISFLLINIYLLFWEKSKKQILKRILFAEVPFFVIFIIYQIWLSKTGLTLAQYFAVQGPAKQAIDFNIIHFFIPSKAPVINKNFIDSFIQRTSGYFVLGFGFLFPSLLIYKSNLKNTLKIMGKMKKYLFYSLSLFLFFGLADHLNKSKFTSQYPGTRLLTHSNLVDWHEIWPIVIAISLPFWIFAVALTIRKVFGLLLSIRSKINFKGLKITVSAVVFILFLYVIRLIQNNYPTFFTFKIIIGKFDSASLFIFLLNSPLYLLTIVNKSFLISNFVDEMWLYVLVLVTIIVCGISLIFVLKTKKINIDHASLLFIFLIFTSSFFATIFLAYFYWINYFIQFIPFFVIWSALVFRNSKVNYLATTIVIIATLLLSLQITRNRFQNEGVRWETADRLITEKGIEPIRISSINWAWNPYWYFQSSLAETISQAGGNKYNIKFNKLASWPVVSPEGSNYELTSIPCYVDTQSSLTPDEKLFFVSENYWDFTGCRKVLAIGREIK